MIEGLHNNYKIANYHPKNFLLVLKLPQKLLGPAMLRFDSYNYSN